MNLIGNSCVSAFIIRDFLKEEYTNPFCWNIIDYKSMYNLIKYYDTINFLNYKLENSSINKNTFSVIIDKKVVVNYIHYIKDEKIDGLKFEKSNIFSNNIEKYIIEKYENRVRKMILKKESPIFLLAAGYNQEYYYTDDEINSILDLNSPYKIIISYDKCNVKPRGNSIILNHNLKMNVDGVHFKLASFISKNIFNIYIDENSYEKPLMS